MRSFLRVFQRYASTASTSVAGTSAASPVPLTSIPLEIQRRRAEQNLTAENVAKDAQERAAKQHEMAERRSRVRGVRQIRGPDGQVTEKVVGQRIYLPTLIFRMVRNHTPPGQPYNPYEATFRVPLSTTKTDIRSYLLAVYGVETTYIRTDNYFVPENRRAKDREEVERTRVAYKRAVVGLVKPFYYPLAMEDMNGKDRWLRQAFLENTFGIKQSQENGRRLRSKMLRQSSKKWAPWGGQLSNASRPQLKAKSLQRKEEKEQRTREAAEVLKRQRSET